MIPNRISSLKIEFSNGNTFKANVDAIQEIFLDVHGGVLNPPFATVTITFYIDDIERWSSDELGRMSDVRQLDSGGRRE